MYPIVSWVWDKAMIYPVVSWMCGTKRSLPISDRAYPYVCVGHVPFAVGSLHVSNASLGSPSPHASGCSTPPETWPHSAFARSTRPSFLLRCFELALAHLYHGHPAHTSSWMLFHAVVTSYPPCRTDPRSTHAFRARHHTQLGCWGHTHSLSAAHIQSFTCTCHSHTHFLRFSSSVFLFHSISWLHVSCVCETNRSAAAP